uniref:Uncharacterized protein n=1 Tax=Ewingella americana TaxID=41202 RepID=A0A502GFK1_9GAMM
MPAAALPSSLFQFVILVNHKKFDFNPMRKKEIKSFGPDTKWDTRLSLPNKDIRIVPMSMKFDPSCYDEVIYCDPFDPRSTIGDYLDWALGSAHYAVKQGYYFNWCQPSNTKLVLDSGGAQLKVGTADYVNPYEIIDVMNHAANAGFALDVPPKLDIDIKNGMSNDILAHLQKRNNNVFLQHRRPDLALLNILHGTTVPEFKRWLDIVQDDGFQGWALGIDDSNDFLAGVRGALVLHEHFKGSDKPWWLHIFGASGPKIIPAMAWFGRVHPHITSDSSSWFEGARRGTYYILNEFGLMFNTRLSHHLKDRSILKSITGQNKQNTDFCWSPAGMLPCQCDICNTMQYTDSIIDHPYEAAMMSLHDLMTMKRFGHIWNTMAQTMTYQEYYATTRLLMGSKAADMVQYIEVGLQSGLQEAEALFTGGPSNNGRKQAGLVTNSSGGRKMGIFGNRDMSKFSKKTDAPADKIEELPVDVILSEDEDGILLKEELRQLAMEDNEKFLADEEDVAAPAEPLEAAAEDDDQIIESTDEVPLDVPTEFAVFNRKHKVRGLPGLVWEDPSSPVYGYCSAIQVGEQEGQPEPKLGWPTSKYVARMGSAWICVTSTRYQLKWKDDKCTRVILPPKLINEEAITASLPSSCPLRFAQGSNVECLMNYIDPNSPEDMDLMSTIHPDLPMFIYYKLINTPEYWRMMDFGHDRSYTPTQLTEEDLQHSKRWKLHKAYSELREELQKGNYDFVPSFVDNPEFFRKTEPARP